MAKKIKDIGNEKHFHRHWPNIDSSRWPGKELKIAYTYPAHTVLLLGAVTWEIVVTILKFTSL